MSQNIIYLVLLPFFIVFASNDRNKNLRKSSLTETINEKISAAELPKLALDTSAFTLANLTHWRQHRRKKRFILFENAGICKLVTGITYPVNLSDKRPWRQLVLTFNFQYQFPVPARPWYWWEKFSNRQFANAAASLPAAPTLYANKVAADERDEAQEMLYLMFENFLERRQVNGRQCLLKLICENAQIHEHHGVYSEILHRVLRPHNNLDRHYVQAWEIGNKFKNCSAIYSKAKNCIVDQYLHTREDFMNQSFL